MAATADETRRAIQPGSLEQGTRGGVEAGLQQVLGQQGGGAGGGGGVAPAGPLPSPNDPMGALLGSGLGGDSSLPITDGLEMGP